MRPTFGITNDDEVGERTVSRCIDAEKYMWDTYEAQQHNVIGELTRYENIPRVIDNILKLTSGEECERHINHIQTEGRIKHGFILELDHNLKRQQQGKKHRSMPAFTFVLQPKGIDTPSSRQTPSGDNRSGERGGEKCYLPLN